MKTWAAHLARLGFLSFGLCSCRSEPTHSLPTTAEWDVPHRRDQQAQFWASHGVTFTAEFESDWVALTEPAHLILTIRNAGPRELRLPWSRVQGTWPFRHREFGRVYLDLQRQAVSVQWGRYESAERVARDPWSESVSVIPPFSQLSWRTPIDLPLAESQDYGEITAEAFLLPLSVEFDGEPERFSPIRFPRCTVQFAPSATLAATSRPCGEELQTALATNPHHIVAVAVRCAEQDVIAVADALIAELPGPSFAARDAILTALGRVTGEDLGRQVELWRSWWESAQGAAWAMQRRRQQLEFE